MAVGGRGVARMGSWRRPALLADGHVRRATCSPDNRMKRIATAECGRNDDANCAMRKITVDAYGSDVAVVRSRMPCRELLSESAPVEPVSPEFLGTGGKSKMTAPRAVGRATSQWNDDRRATSFAGAWRAGGFSVVIIE